VADPFDVLRLLVFATFGIGVGFMVVTNTISFRVLRPAHRLGFLWWHVSAVSTAFLCFGVVAVERVAGRLGDPSSWYGWVTLVGSVLFCVSQLLIFRIERARLVEKRALGRVSP
jgi:hypothetical protein